MSKLPKVTAPAWHVVVALSRVLSIVVLVLIGIDITENYFQDTSYPNFSGGPSRTIAGYNLVAPFLLLTLLLGKRFLFSFVLTPFYTGLHAYSIWLRLQGCYLGQDICPPVPLMTKLMNRLDWVDLIVTVVLGILFAWHLVIFTRRSMLPSVKESSTA